MTRFLLAVSVAMAGLLAAQQQQPTKPQQSKKQERDLKYERVDEDAGTLPPEPKKAGVPRSYAVVIGISQYKSLPEKAQLKFPERDADQVYGILISPEGGSFRAENVKKLTGQRATLANMRQQIGEWLPAVAKEDDRVLIYFAGHGFVYNGKAYLAPYDIDPNDITRTGFPMDALGQIIGSKVKAKWKVLVTDSCHSGAILPMTDAAAMNSKLQQVAPSLFSLTASRDRELSYESPDWGGGHGVFTYYVVQGLQGEADSTGDGIVTADELGEYVRREVRQATNGAQNPTFERASFDNNMPLAYPPARASAANLPKPKTGTLVFESNMDGVEVFVNGVSQGVASKGTPLRVPGLNPGSVTVQGVKMGYEPDGPREERVYPGQESTVTFKILIPRRRKASAQDLFNKGVAELQRGGADHYRKAVEFFGRALQEDARDSAAALYLARGYHALAEEGQARKYFEVALKIDPDYTEARANFGGMLLDIGDLDESIRQLNRVLTRDARHFKALEHLSQALFRKSLDATTAEQKKTMLADAIEAARKAIALQPETAEPHLWLAEALRNQGEQKGAVAEYRSYLKLSAFDSGVAGQVNYYVVGFLIGMGKKRRASESDIWRELRTVANFGLCDSYRRVGELEAAIGACRTALSFDPQDPLTHYILGLAYHVKAKKGDPLENLSAARQHYATMLRLNPDLDEARQARANLANVEENLKVLMAKN